MKRELENRVSWKRHYELLKHRDGIKRPKTIGAESIHMTLSYLGQDPKSGHFEFCFLHNDGLFHCGSTTFDFLASTSICMPRIKEN